MLDDTALSPMESASILAKLTAERDGAARRMTALGDGPFARFALLTFYPHTGRVLNASEMLEVTEREIEGLAREVRRLGAAIVECERRAALWTEAHTERVAQRAAFAAAKARVERLTYAITNQGRPAASIGQMELDALSAAVGQLHAAARVLLPMLDTSDEKTSVRGSLDVRADESLQVRGFPPHLLARVKPVPAPVAAVEV